MDRHPSYAQPVTPRHTVGEFSRRMAEIREQEAALNDIDALLEFAAENPPTPPVEDDREWLIRR